MTTTSDPAAIPSPPIPLNDSDPPTPQAAPAGAPDKPASPRPSTWALLRPMALRVHFFAGVLVAPFLAVLCVTGLAYVFSPQLNDLVYQDQFFVDEPGGPVRPLTDQVAAALAATPGATLSAVEPATEPERTTKVALSLPGLAEGESHAVFVNPYTAQVQGSLTFLHSEPPLGATLRNLHGDLLLGDVGRLYSEFAASWLPVLVFGGLLLWWSQSRGTQSRGAQNGRTQRRSRRSARALLLPPRGAGRAGAGSAAGTAASGSGSPWRCSSSAPPG